MLCPLLPVLTLNGLLWIKALVSPIDQLIYIHSYCLNLSSPALLKAVRKRIIDAVGIGWMFALTIRRRKINDYGR